MNICLQIVLVIGLILELCVCEVDKDKYPRGRTPSPNEVDRTAPTIIGLRIESYDAIQGFENGTVEIYADVEAPIRFFGSNFNQNTRIIFTTHEYDKGTQCDDVDHTRDFSFYDFGEIDANNFSNTGVANVKLRIPERKSGENSEKIRVMVQDA